MKEAALSLRHRSVVVTGGAGFVGSHLVDRLVRESPRRLTVIDDLSIGREKNLAEARKGRTDIELHVVDATRLCEVRTILRRVEAEVVFDLATVPLPVSLVRPQWAAESICRMATTLAELARLGEFATLIHCSSSEVYGTAVSVPMSEDHPIQPETPYAAGKAAADLVLRSYWETFGIDVAIIRPFNTYGPRQNERGPAGVIPATLARLRHGGTPVIFGDGEQTRDYLYVSDTVEALVAAYRVPGSRKRVINIGSGTEVSINHLVRRLCEQAGWNGTPIHEPARPADVRRHLAGTSLAAEILDFRPRVSLADGLRSTVEWYMRTGTEA